MPEIPQATLYRHLGGMVEKGAIRVAREQKKRALYEKVYAVTGDFQADVNEMLKQNRGDLYAALFFQYMMVFYRDFQAYALRPDIDIAKDGSGFSMGPVYATDEELGQTMKEIGALLETLRGNLNKPAPGRKLRTVGLILSPPKDAEAENTDPK